ncbi:MAG: hypothetical protein GF335_02765 [Candidatus Moranbacteria bacterium]|nr:hypothetical protein [Candidatus Moranbacteria bacterium]
MDKSNYDFEDLIASGLDGLKVLERRDDTNDLEALSTYKIDTDHEGNRYLSWGIMVIREESRGEGIFKEELQKLLNIARQNRCEYISAIADTNQGAVALESSGFYLEQDEINKRNYYRFDLDD